MKKSIITLAAIFIASSATLITVLNKDNKGLTSQRYLELEKALEKVDRLVIREVEPTKGYPNPKVIVDTTNKEEIKTLVRAIKLTPKSDLDPTTDSWTKGDQPMYFYEEGKELVTITSVDEKTLRCSLWDAEVEIENPKMLSEWREKNYPRAESPK